MRQPNVTVPSERSAIHSPSPEQGAAGLLSLSSGPCGRRSHLEDRSGARPYDSASISRHAENNQWAELVRQTSDLQRCGGTAFKECKARRSDCRLIAIRKRNIFVGAACSMD